MNFKRTAALMGGLALAAGAAPHAAEARVWVGVGIGAPFYWGPAPYYYAPPPVYYAPPPVYYAPPAPAPTTYISQPRQNYYYCSNPQGYYPRVPSCTVPWQEVPNAPPAAVR